MTPSDAGVFTVPGDGDIDFPALLDALIGGATRLARRRSRARPGEGASRWPTPRRPGRTCGTWPACDDGRRRSSEGMTVTYKPIEDYGVIGDLSTIALVGDDGSIDYMCLPHFDSPSIFAALLDDKRGGKFTITPAIKGARRKQMYLPDTNILLTRFLSDDGVGEITDFMVIDDDDRTQAIVRRVKGIRGPFSFHLRCAPRFDYARAHHKVERRDDQILFLRRGRGRHDAAAADAGAADGRRRRRRGRVHPRVPARPSTSSSKSRCPTTRTPPPRPAASTMPSTTPCTTGEPGSATRSTTVAGARW